MASSRRASRRAIEPGAHLAWTQTAAWGGRQQWRDMHLERYVILRNTALVLVFVLYPLTMVLIHGKDLVT